MAKGKRGWNLQGRYMATADKMVDETAEVICMLILLVIVVFFLGCCIAAKLGV